MEFIVFIKWYLILTCIFASGMDYVVTKSSNRCSNLIVHLVLTFVLSLGFPIILSMTLYEMLKYEH
jgi:hypothetical protein